MRKNAMMISGGALILGIGAAVFGIRAHDGAMDAVRAERDALASELDVERDLVLELSGELEEAKRRMRAVETQTTAMKADLETVRAALDDLSAPPPAPEPVADAAGDWHAVVSAYPVFRPDGVGEALDDVDWEVVAESMSNMPALISDFAVHINEGRGRRLQRLRDLLLEVDLLVAWCGHQPDLAQATRHPAPLVDARRGLDRCRHTFVEAVRRR